MAAWSARSRCGVLLALLMVVFMAPAAMAAGATRYSGTVAAVDQDKGILVLEVIGPWKVVKGVTQTTRHTIAVSGSTEFLRVTRRAKATGQEWPGGFATERLAAWAVKVGDYVTVELVPEAKRATAATITIATPS